jgi:hypothetical protein
MLVITHLTVTQKAAGKQPGVKDSHNIKDPLTHHVGINNALQSTPEGSHPLANPACQPCPTTKYNPARAPQPTPLTRHGPF